MLRTTYGERPDNRQVCETLQAHRALLSVETSPIVAPFARVKQRLDSQRQENQNKVKELETRQAVLKTELGDEQQRLAEGPKLIVSNICLWRWP